MSEQQPSPEYSNSEFNFDALQHEVPLQLSKEVVAQIQEVIQYVSKATSQESIKDIEAEINSQLVEAGYIGRSCTMTVNDQSRLQVRAQYLTRDGELSQRVLHEGKINYIQWYFQRLYASNG